MLIIRPIKAEDLDILEEFARSSSLGMTSMPRKRSLLEKKIEHSLEAFESDISFPERETYLFVLEDSETNEVGGSCGIYSKTGVNDPLYYFKIEILNQVSDLPIPDELRVLHPVSYRNGPTEMCGLFLSKEFRQGGLGRLLSLSRFLFIASHPHRFDTTVMAQLRGVIRKSTKSSPFWEHLGQHFLNLPFQEAMAKLDYGRGFIEEFLPEYPIYASLLPHEAQRVMGATHESTKPAFKMLYNEGFRYTFEIDIFEAGPRLVALRDEIRTIQECHVAKIRKIEGDEMKLGRRQLICNGRMDFRCCIGKAHQTHGEVVIDEKLAKALQVDVGDEVRYVNLH